MTQIDVDGAIDGNERSLYLGVIFPHFGHFILESVSRTWVVQDFSASFDKYYFHPWDQGMSDEITKQDFFKTCLDALGIDRSRIHIIQNEGQWIQNCLIPDQLFNINHQVHHKQASIFNVVREFARDCCGAARNSPISRQCRVYLSRSRQHRRAENEAALEALFRAHGFEVVVPEGLPFSDQVQLAAEADIMAGCDGSALHLAAFSPSARIISLDSRLVVNQLLLEALGGLTAHHIWAIREQLTGNRWIADETLVRDSLSRLLAA